MFSHGRAVGPDQEAMFSAGRDAMKNIQAELNRVGISMFSEGRAVGPDQHERFSPGRAVVPDHIACKRCCPQAS